MTNHKIGLGKLSWKTATKQHVILCSRVLKWELAPGRGGTGISGGTGKLQSIGYTGCIFMCREQRDHFFDTAEVYGIGQSETMLGQFCKQVDVPIQVASKCFPFPGV